MLTTHFAVEQIQQSLGEAQRQLHDLSVQLTAWEQTPSEPMNGAPHEAGEKLLSPLLLGATLASDLEIAADRKRFVGGVATGDPAALALAGRLLLFRAARAEQMPPLVKEIGEAFYQWSNESAEPAAALRDALASMLVDACAAAGLRHSIELACVGDRFDRMRHHASEAGLELTEVRGWVVLRENGSVYTKAAVATK
ncbi:MAG TPA: hypothetical protein VHZ24_22145 [Pirellulales bacterium]|jgi:hypothetical protein|nr:hypothetical protein [Pirellulales bacterium]